MKVKFVKVHEDAKLPYRATPDAACSDLYSVERVEVRQGQTVKIDTGLQVGEIPEGHYLAIFDRSGMRAKGVFGSSVGVIDQDFRGVLKVILYNSSKDILLIKPGERIAQCSLEKVLPVSYEFTETFTDTERSSGGFGSTGLK